jgi:hypothetical protein
MRQMTEHQILVTANGRMPQPGRLSSIPPGSAGLKLQDLAEGAALVSAPAVARQGGGLTMTTGTGHPGPARAASSALGMPHGC